jgi:hypothetical protein
MGYVPTSSMSFEFNIDYYNNTQEQCTGYILSKYNTKIICKKPTSIIDCCSAFLNTLNISNGNYNDTVGVCLNKTNNEDYSNMYITCGYDKMKGGEIAGILIIAAFVCICACMAIYNNNRQTYDRL